MDRAVPGAIPKVQMLSETQMITVFVVVVTTSMIVWFVVSYRRHQEATRLAACRWCERSAVSDDDFLNGCAIPGEPLPVMVALAARRVIGELGTVPPETIHPDDSFDRDLVQLPFWDSLDWMSLVLGIDEKFDGQVDVRPSCFDDAWKAARDEGSDLRVRHVVRALALGATGSVKKALCDDEL
jgi:acyl carrier protein